MREVQLYRAVAQARQDIAEGIDVNLAVAMAARQYSVSASVVAAYALPAFRACCKAADEVEEARPY